MAEIFRARELTASGREVALKIIRTDLTDDPTVSRRFLREVRALCRLCHPHILSPIAWGEAEGICYLVLPWVRDSTLSHLLNARGGVLTLEETLPLFGQLCQAVHNTHEAGIIHRDLKPHNVLVQQGTHVLLADFGVALDSTASRLTLTGGKPGSAEYDPGRTSRCENDLTQTWYKLPAPRRPRTAIPRRVCAGSRIPPKSTRGKTALARPPG